MPTKTNLSSFIQDCDDTHANALGFINDAQKSQKAAADKCARVLAPATLGASEASSAKAIFTNVDAQQDALISAGLDPQKVFGGLLNHAGTLAESAKKRLIDASAASQG